MLSLMLAGLMAPMLLILGLGLQVASDVITEPARNSQPPGKDKLSK